MEKHVNINIIKAIYKIALKPLYKMYIKRDL